MITKDFKFENGDFAEDKVTGFQGTITGTCFYLTGCTQYLLTSASTEIGKEPTSLWYDEGRLNLVTKSKFTKEDVQSEENGCDIAPNLGKRGG